jgi:hypothetical protein
LKLMLALDPKFFGLGLDSQQLIGALGPTPGTAMDFSWSLDLAF